MECIDHGAHHKNRIQHHAALRHHCHQTFLVSSLTKESRPLVLITFLPVTTTTEICVAQESAGPCVMLALTSKQATSPQIGPCPLIFPSLRSCGPNSVTYTFTVRVFLWTRPLSTLARLPHTHVLTFSVFPVQLGRIVPFCAHSTVPP